MKNQGRFLVVFIFVTLFNWSLRYTGPKYAFAQEPYRPLHPPYYGETSVNAVFDHEFPVYCRRFPDFCRELDYLRDNPRCSTSDERTVGTQVLHYDGLHSKVLPYSGHNGIDFGLNYRHVLASHGGAVHYAGWFNSADRREALGLYIDLRTITGLRTDYGHMSVLMVETGGTVAQGNVIGISGNTGNSDGPHLHFSVRRNGVVVNPYGWRCRE